MKHIIYTIVCSMAILFASCTKNDVLITTDEAGYLSLQNVEKISPIVSTVTSRADANTQADDLTVEIWQGEKRLFQLSEAEVNVKVKLDAGDYELKVYSSNYGNESDWTNDDKGTPIYYKEESFSIKAGETCFLTVKVPMLVYAVQLTLPDSFSEWFPTYAFTVTSGARSVALKAGETAYFSYTSGTTFAYKLTMQNTDGEEQSKEGTYGTDPVVQQGHLYDVNYSLASQTLSAFGN